MSEPTTIPVGTKIYPYSTPDGIIQLVPLEALTAATVKSDTLEHEVNHLRQAVAELNDRLIERTRDMLAKQTELIQEARQARREARDAHAELAAARGEGQAQEVPQAEAKAESAHPALTQANNPLFLGGPAILEARPSNVMLDLETLGTNPGCVILSIGAVLFGNGRLHDEFYSRISLASAEESGLTIEADTLQWWTMQPPEVFAEALAGTTPLITVLTEFQQWVTRHVLPKNWNIWSNGASFDAPVLKAAYKRIGMRTPWTHSQERCFRTLRALDPHEPKVEPIIKHHALEDAKAQALHAMRIAPWL